MTGLVVGHRHQVDHVFPRGGQSQADPASLTEAAVFNAAAYACQSSSVNVTFGNTTPTSCAYSSHNRMSSPSFALFS